MWKKENLQAATTLPFDVKTEELEIETRQKVSSECLLQTFYNKAFNGLLNNIPSCGFFPHKCITLWPFYD